LVGQRLWIRGGRRTVELYTSDDQLVWTHTRLAAGERETVDAHLPVHKLAGLRLSRERVQHQADAVGPATSSVVTALLAHRPEDRLRSAGRLLTLSARYGADRLEQACQRAVAFDQREYPTVKRILQEGLDTARADPHPALLSVERPAYAFARQAWEFAGALLGVGR
jgi:hypothetical protein